MENVTFDCQYGWLLLKNPMPNSPTRFTTFQGPQPCSPSHNLYAIPPWASMWPAQNVEAAMKLMGFHDFVIKIGIEL